MSLCLCVCGGECCLCVCGGECVCESLLVWVSLCVHVGLCMSMCMLSGVKVACRQASLQIALVKLENTCGILECFA